MQLARSDAQAPRARWRLTGPGGYAFGLGAFALALATRFWATPYLPPSGFPFLTFFPAVALTAFVGGIGAGLLVSAMSTVAAWYFFLRGHGAASATAVALVFFVTVLVIDCLVIHVMNTSLDRLRAERERSARLASELERASREKSRLMATLGHDLKQPLNVIGMAVQLLTTGERDPDRLRDLSNRTRRNLHDLERSLDLLVDASRLDADELSPDVQPVSLSAVLEQVADEFAPLAAKGALSLVVAPAELTVATDRDMFLSIVRNFVANAIKYTSAGGVVRVEAAAPRDGDARRPSVVVWVVDDGPGIPCDKLDAIFRMFERLDPGRADGLGLGLALVRKTADLLGHRVFVESEVGRGSRFGIEVPVVTA